MQVGVCNKHYPYFFENVGPLVLFGVGEFELKSLIQEQDTFLEEEKKKYQLN